MESEVALLRKVVASEIVSLDGVVESPEEWHFPYFNDEMGEAIGEAMAASDAMLLGRVTYEGFAAFWPAQEGGEDDQEIAEYMNNTPSSSSQKPWKSP
jgi:dihydrofolate reductase